jgi:hypothetical protein
MKALHDQIDQELKAVINIGSQTASWLEMNLVRHIMEQCIDHIGRQASFSYLVYDELDKHDGA